MTAQHTPGPWHTHRTTTYIAVRAQARIQVAQLWKSKRAPVDQEADARLIAAAPELFEALKGLMAHFESGKSLATGRAVIKLDCLEARAAYAAIAKAEGGAV